MSSKYNTGPDDLTTAIADLDRRISILERVPSLSSASIDSGDLTIKGGNIKVTDPNGVVQVVLGHLSDGSYGMEVLEAGSTFHQVPFVYSDFVTANESTTSVPFTDLPTLGPTVSVPVRSSGKVLVIFGATMSVPGIGSGALWGAFMNCQLTGANTVAPTSIPGGLGFTFSNGASISASSHSTSRATIISGLSSGTTQFQAKYAVNNGAPGETAFFRNRALVVFAL